MMPALCGSQRALQGRRPFSWSSLQDGSLIGGAPCCSALPTTRTCEWTRSPPSRCPADVRVVTLARHLVMGTAGNWKGSVY